MRCLPLIPSFLALACTCISPTRLSAAESWAPPRVVLPELQATLDDLIAHGFPDVRAGTLMNATLVISGLNPHGLSRAERLLDLGNPGFDAAGDATYTGLHLRLADGSWFVWCAIPFLSGDPAHITERELTPWRLPEHLEPTAGVSLFEQAIFPGVEPQVMTWAWQHAAFDQTAGIGGWQINGQLPVLIGQHFPEIDHVAVQYAIYAERQRLISHDLDRLGDHAPLQLFTNRILDDQNDRQALSERLMQHPGSITWDALRPAAVIQEQALHWWERRALRGLGGAPALAEIHRLSRLLATTTSVMAEADIDRLPAIAALVPPATPHDLAERLITWEPPNPRPRRRSAKIAREQAPAADRFAREDLPALASLVADERPSRWISRELSDNGTPRLRTIGDNALRAMAQVLSLDPRWLIDMAPGAAWNADARRRAGAALVALFPEGSTLDPLPLIARAVPRLRCRDLAYALSGFPASQRGPLVTAIAAAWAQSPPINQWPEHDDFATVLALAGPDHDLAETVRALGARATNLPAAALYLANQGDETALDALVAQLTITKESLVEQAGLRPGETYFTRECMVAWSVHPQAKRTDAILAWCSTDWQRMSFLLQNTGANWGGSIKLLTGVDSGMTSLAPAYDPTAPPPAWSHGPAQGLAPEALHLALILRALDNRTPIPSELIHHEAAQPGFTVATTWFPLIAGTTSSPQVKEVTGTPANDLRACDLLAADLASSPSDVTWLADDDQPAPRFDCRAALPERDAVLAEWRDKARERARRVFAEAGLPIDGLPTRAPGTGNGF